MTSAPSSASTATIHCNRSGLPLLALTPMNGLGWPILSHPALKHIIHPIYEAEMSVLLPQMRNEIQSAEHHAWMVEDAELRKIGLLMSAIMYKLELIWVPPVESHAKNPPSLPNNAIIVGCATRLYSLATWYWHATSKRIAFPLYRISKLNNNLSWENYHTWLNDAFEVQASWASRKELLAAETQRKLADEAIKAVKSDSIYKRIDTKKVWNWIDIQLSAAGTKYPAGRRETFKNLFLSGELSPEDWLVDDVEDLQFAIADACDIGNDISFFINKRLNGIKAVIVDFYSSFTVLHSKGAADALTSIDATPEEQAAENKFFLTFDARADALDSLPAAPDRKDFASLGLFLKAQAQHAILKRRWEAKQASGPAAGIGNTTSSDQL